MHDTFHVSPAGNDAHDGRSPEPGDDAHGPFATLERVRDAVRAAREADPEARCEVRLRGGTYWLPRTLELGPEDSGTADKPVVYAAFPGERPVISGGRPLAGWTSGTHAGQVCWTTAIPEVRGGAWAFRQLFVNGRRRSRPCLPKQGCYRFASIPAGAADPENRAGFGPTCACFRTGDLSAAWHDLDAVELVALHHWYSIHLRIRKVDPVLSEVAFLHRSMGSLRDESGQPARYRAENVFEALSEPGEWQPPPEFVGSLQAGCHVPGAVVFADAEYCALRGCQVAHVSQYGVQVERGCHACTIDGCEITDMGGGGVRIDSDWISRDDERLSPHAPRQPTPGAKPNATRVTNCSIHDGTRIYPGAIGVWIGNTGHVHVLDNHIYNLNYTGISSGWTWGYAPSATVGIRIEGNHIHHICWGGPLSDNGGIYLLGRHPGGVVAGNHVHHIGSHYYGANGIYLDEGTSFVTVQGNVIHHCRNGLLIHYGRSNLVRDNIFALCWLDAFRLGRTEEVRSCRFERNLLYATEGQPAGGIRDARHLLVRDSLLWKEGLPADFAGGANLAEWQARGQMAGCLVADPLFFDPEGGDFTLRADSPALRLGFQPSALRAAAAAPAAPMLSTDLEWVETGLCRLTVRNHGAAPASGGLRLRAGPAGVARLREPGEFRFAGVPPDGSVSMDLHVDGRTDTEEHFVETVPGADGPMPVFLSRVGEVRMRAGRCPAVRAATDVQAALAAAPWQVVPKPTVGEAFRWRLGVAPDALLLQVQVADLLQVTNALPWFGSSVEIFVAPVGQARPTQIVFAPGSGWRGTTATRFAKGAVPEPRAAGACAPLDGCGYDLPVIIPLDVVRLAPGTTEFLFEMAVNASGFAGGHGLGRQQVFGAGCAHASTLGFGRMIVS